MKMDRFLLAMVGLTVVLQIVGLYRQPQGPGSRPPAVRDAPAGSVVDITGSPVKGRTDARVVMIEFSDYECPFCSKYATSTGKEIDRQFVSTGKLQYAFMNNPLPNHQNAMAMATAAICAGDQNRYWEMHDRLFTDAKKTKIELASLAHELGLDSAKFGRCVEESEGAAKQIAADQKKAKDLQLSGTPAFAVGILDGRGQVSVKKVIVGAQELGVFEKAVEQLLQDQKTSDVSKLN